MSKLRNFLKKLIGRIKDMPSCKTRKWRGLTFQLLPKDKDIIRNLMRFIPYFWGDEIYLDLFVRFPPKKGIHLLMQGDVPDNKWIYKWEVFGKNKKVISSGYDTLNFNSKISNISGRKYNAVKIGEEDDLDIGKYKIYISFSDGKGNMSEKMFITSFTVRDKEDYLSSYLLPAIIAFLISLAFAVFKK
jgi:hypothetical protein